MQPVSKGLYLGVIITGYILGFFLFLGAVIAVVVMTDGGDKTPDPELLVPALGIGGLGLLGWLTAAILGFVLIYKMWAAIQDGRARTTPGAAVGLLFVPFYNLYWIFQVYYGWAQDYNRFIDRYRIDAPRASENMGLAIPILSLMGNMPYIGLLFTLASYIVMLVFYSAAIDGINAIADAAPDLERYRYDRHDEDWDEDYDAPPPRWRDADERREERPAERRDDYYGRRDDYHGGRS